MLCHDCGRDTKVVILINGVPHCLDCGSKQYPEPDDKDTKHELRQVPV